MGYFNVKKICRILGLFWNTRICGDYGRSERRLVLQGSQACRAGLATFTTCHTCGQRFHGVYQKYNLKRHMSIHTGERPYPCPCCPAAFNQKCNMKRHLESVHGIKIPSHWVSPPQDLPQTIASSNQSALTPSNQCVVAPSSQCSITPSTQPLLSPTSQTVGSSGAQTVLQTNLEH